MLGMLVMDTKEVNWDVLISVAGDILAFQAIPHITSLTALFLINSEEYAWYRRSVKRPFWDFFSNHINPIFALLHSALGAASYLIYQHENSWVNPVVPLALCGMQLMFDFTWRPLYFNQKNWDRSLRHAAVCTVLSSFVHYLYQRIDKTAGLLFLPYPIWWCYLTTVVWYVRFINDPPEPWRRLSFGGYPMRRRTFSLNDEWLGVSTRSRDTLVRGVAEMWNSIVLTVRIGYMLGNRANNTGAGS